MKTSLLVMFLVGVSLAANMARASEKYVDIAGSRPCSDAPSYGSELHPWCRINYAVGQVRQGDIVYVKNGNYLEDVYIIGKDGGADYITIQNYPGHAPVIHGSGVGSGRNKLVNSSFIKLSGFTLTNFQQGLFVERSNNIVLQNLRVYNVGHEAIHIRFNSSFVTLKDSIIYDTGKLSRYGEGVYIGTSSSQQPNSPPYDNTHNILITGNTIYNTTDECIEVKEGAHNVTIDRNTMHDCLLDAKITDPNWGSIEVMEHRRYYSANPRHVIKNNVIRTTKTGVGVHTGATVFNNIIYGQTANFRGISIDNPDSDNYARLVYHNTVDLPDSRAVVISSGTLADIRNNIGPVLRTNMRTQGDLFVNQRAGDYQLAAGSAAIGAGADLREWVTEDIKGHSRLDRLRPDLGAYVFGVDPSQGR